MALSPALRRTMKPFGSIAERLSPVQRSTLALILVFWIFVFLVASARSAFAGEVPFDVLAHRRVGFAFFGALLCLGMAEILHLLRFRSFPERIAWGLLGALLMSILFTLVATWVNRRYLPIPGRPPISFGDFGQWAILWLGYFLAWTGTQLALTYSWESSDQQRRASAMTQAAQQAQIAALRYQISPHFLFNTLNSISSLMLERRTDEAERMLLNLSTFFRSTLSTESSGTIALGEELALQRLYLDIERERFSERMGVEFAVPASLEGARVPPLILQPLVENAIRHGVGRSEAVTCIRVSARDSFGRLHIVVEDDARPESGPRKGTGLGLANVAQRLRAHFEDEASLEAGALAEGGYRAEIRLPLDLP